MDVEIKIEGAREMEARLLEMDALAGQKLITRVLRKIARPMMLRAQANALTNTGLATDQMGPGRGRSRALAKSVKVMTRKNRADVVSTVVVTTHAKDRTAVYLHNATYKRRRKGIFYGWMVDQGGRLAKSGERLIRESTALTKKGFDRYERRRVRAVGQKGRIRGARGWGFRKPYPWWSPAVQATDRAATNQFIGELQKAMKRIEARKTKTANPETVIPE